VYKSKDFVKLDLIRWNE